MCNPRLPFAASRSELLSDTSLFPGTCHLSEPLTEGVGGINMGSFRGGVAFHSTQWLRCCVFVSGLSEIKIRRTLPSSALLPLVFLKNHKFESLQSVFHWDRSPRLSPQWQRPTRVRWTLFGTRADGIGTGSKQYRNDGLLASLFRMGQERSALNPASASVPG